MDKTEWRQAKRLKDSYSKEKKDKKIKRLIQSSLYKLLNEKTKEVIQEYPNLEPELELVNSDSEDSGSRSDEYNPLMDQFA
ncbi:hypothetical protein H5410_044810 [Solanum commersonii]|uniref:Uncharacterized protein n=1 Tax=Solanum commersonii TaxID=4109 RepID=A0A9J5XBX7_SOLCO|nr:hypothetical protein H5410_044810 [Solanum commersonii]